MAATDAAGEHGDALTAPFWQGARERRLLVQRCRDCGHHQLYPRPFCLRCQSDGVEWAEAGGLGTVHSATTVRVPVSPEWEPPYTVALVELDEGPRLLARLRGEPAPIGSRVRVAWHEREGRPPLPVFEPDITGASSPT